MLYVFWVVSFFSVIYYAIRNKTSKNYRRIFLIGIFLYMWVMLGWSSGAYDVEIGISRYVNYRFFQSFTELGYNFIIVLCHQLGMNYRAFFVICAFFELIVMFWFVDKNCSKSPIVFGIFLVYPLVIYFQYIRNILAFTFVLIAIDCLKNKTKNYTVKYVMLIVIAASIHISSLFYLAYLPLSFCKKKKAFIATVISSILLYLSKGMQIFSTLLTMLVGQEKTDIVLRTTTVANGTFGRIVAIFFTILLFFIIYYMLKWVYKISMKDEISDLYYKMNLISFALIPLTVNFGVGFARISTLLLIVNYVFLVDKISEVHGQGKRLFIYFILLTLLLWLLFLNYRNLEYRQLVLYPFFDSNDLINWILNR